MWRAVIDCQNYSLPGLFGVRLTKSGAFSRFVNTLKQMNIRLIIENNVASSGARILQPGQLLSSWHVEGQIYFIPSPSCRPLFKNALSVCPSVSQT